MKDASSNPPAAGMPTASSDAATGSEVTLRRVEQLSKDAGWGLITAGVIGLAVPGVLGTPFLLAGAVALTPGGSQLMARWISRNQSKFVHSTLRQLSRFLDDLERRYPRR